MTKVVAGGKEHDGMFRVMKMSYVLIVVMAILKLMYIYQNLCTFIKTHETGHLTWVNVNVI